MGQTSAWWSHVPFAHWLVAASRPRTFVELGTHTGVSYAAFCEAVRHLGLGSRCFAVDTWQGDSHAGLYGEEIYNDLKTFHDLHYASFSELISSTFDDALGFFRDGSIDLLHIDGLHTYDAVKHDFENWLPKLSDRAVVVLHDTAVRRDDFGVHRFFVELVDRYPTFEFLHGFGLGVVAVGADVPKPVLDLCGLSRSQEAATLRERFAFLGERWLLATREALLVSDLQHRLAVLKGDHEQAGSTLEEERRLREAAEHAQAGVSRELEDLQLELNHQRTALEVERAAANEALRRIEQLDCELADRAQHLASHEAEEGKRDAALCAAYSEIEAARRERDALQISLARADAASARLEHDVRLLVASYQGPPPAGLRQSGADTHDAPLRPNDSEQRLLAQLDLASQQVAVLAKEDFRGHVTELEREIETVQAAADREGAQLRARLDELSASLAKVEAHSLRAEGRAKAAQRMRHNTANRVVELRLVLDAVQAQTFEAREMARALDLRYAQAVSQLQQTLAVHPTRRLKRAARSLTGRRADPLREDDLFQIRSSIYFDADWYFAQYPDVAGEQIDAALHYLLHGGAEDRDPGPWFSTRQYLNNNPDVASAGANALLHFIRHGRVEGRTALDLPKLALPSTEAAAKAHRSWVFITGEPESAGHRYRVLDMIEAAAANGIAARWVRADDLAERSEELATNDVAIFWRVAWTQEVQNALGLLRANGITTLFDVDDLMTEPDIAKLDLIDGIRTQSLTEAIVTEHYARVRRTMLECDACIATTEELAYWMRWVGKVVYVLPNGFNGQVHGLSRMAVRQRRAQPSDGLIRIGYAGGSRTHQKDFAVCSAAVAAILRDNPRCRLVLFRGAGGPLLDPEEFEELRDCRDQIEWRNAVPLSQLPAEMARFDINLAPLEIGNPYCEAKSELKFFEAALVDVPTVASPTGPFRRAIDHGKTGFLAASADDWLFHLRMLVNDAALRARISRAAYHRALGTFGPALKALRFANIARQLKGGVDGASAFAADARLVNHQPTKPGVYPSRVVFERDSLGSADVTVVVPLYNYEQFIVETLDSVVKQSVQQLDLVIVDGSSTDRSLEVAKSWALANASRFNRIVVLQNEANYGLGFCRNSGIDAAETPYIVLLDADNKLLPDACAILAQRAGATGAAFVYPTIQHFGASSALIGNLPYAPQRLAAGNYIDAMALVSKEAWAIAGGVDHVRHGWEDYDFFCRMAELGLRGEWVEKPLALYRVHANSMQTVKTQVPDNYRELMDNFKSRHPWTSLIDQERSRRLPAPRRSLTSAVAQTRLDRILPLLRCPVTHQKLGYDEGLAELRSFDGLRSWSIIEGRPVLMQQAAPVVHPETHVSNGLPSVAIDLIRQTEGWVLNLSAGGSVDRHENVIEAEFSIFRHTDVVVDAHDLPFDDETFNAAIVLNAFEHYRDPRRVAAELHRVLKPGAALLVVTAFLQPLHEKPWHYYNCTRYGLEDWFAAFQPEQLQVTDYLSPNMSMGWIASETESALRAEAGADAADALRGSRIGELIDAFRDPAARGSRSWHDVANLSQAAMEVTGAGFEYIGRKGPDIPVFVK